MFRWWSSQLDPRPGGSFLLSVAAAFGALVAVFQWGWLGSLFGVHHPGPLMSFGPIMIIGVLFGLAMDYQMFLVSGMREAYAHGEGSRCGPLQPRHVPSSARPAAVVSRGLRRVCLVVQHGAGATGSARGSRSVLPSTRS